MKKNLLLAAGIALLGLGMTACDPTEDFGLTGKVMLTVADTQGEQAFADGDTLNFKSALSNVKLDSVMVEDEYYDVNAGTIIVGSTQNIVNSFETLDFPLMGINFRGETAQNYEINLPIDNILLFKYLEATDVNQLISGGLQLGESLGNLFAVAVDENSYYIGYSGSVNITKFGENGSTINGTVNNVKAIYLTASELSELVNKTDEEIAQIDLANYFPTATFNGNIESRRLPLDAVLAALEE